MKVKLCGITTESDIELCVNAGADACGFVVEYPADVPWNLDAKKAASLIRFTPGGTSTFMVTGGSPDRVVSLAREVRPDVVQLHHEETLDDVSEIAARLKYLGISTVKALRISGTGRLHFEIPDIAAAVVALETAGADALLIDSFTRVRPGGSGRVVATGAYVTLRKNTRLPVILAGGLTPDNLYALVPAEYPPYMLDVLSGVESSPGIKDKDKVVAFVKSARACKRRIIYE